MPCGPRSTCSRIRSPRWVLASVPCRSRPGSAIRSAAMCCAPPTSFFGCTDDHEGRLFLNRFAYYYLVPVIDIGLAIEVDDADPPAIRAFDGRVTVLTPPDACLMCRSVVVPEIAAGEAFAVPTLRNTNSARRKAMSRAKATRRPPW